MKKSEKDIIAYVLKELSKRVQTLDDQEFDNLLRGTAQVEIRINSKVQAKGWMKNERMNKSQMKEIRSALELMDSREEGHKLLKDRCETKEDLTRLAKYLDLPVQKSDKVEQLFERIVEATIGYRIRSAAIQGNKGKDT